MPVTDDIQGSHNAGGDPGRFFEHGLGGAVGELGIDRRTHVRLMAKREQDIGDRRLVAQDDLLDEGLRPSRRAA